MDLVSINVLVSILSAFVMMAAIIYVLTFILSSFSSRSGAMPFKVASLSLLYFFGSTIFLFMGVEWLMDQNASATPFDYPSYGAGALGLNALVHIFCGLLSAFLYLRGQISQGLTLQRVIDSIRTRMRSKSKK